MSSYTQTIGQQRQQAGPMIRRKVAPGVPTLSATGTRTAHLQRAVGNQALGRLAIQAKLTLGPVNDPYEQEADAVAKQVVQQMRVPTAGSGEAPAVQRQGSEPMEEFTAIDSAALKVYDLPPGWNMSFDERMGISDPQPTGAAIFWRESMLPVRATVAHGALAAIDQTDAVRTQDFVAVDPGEIDSRFIGRTSQMFAISLEFPQEIAAGAGDPVLRMDGWIEYPYCSTTFAMWQAHASTLAPTFEALDPATGLWMTLVKEYGYPAGMPREAAFPIARNSLPKNCTTLRIVTNQELYVDRCRIVWSQSCPQAIERKLRLQSAVVRASGYARRIPAPQRRPIYDYEARVPLWDCRKQPGWYTATGVDCSPLVTAIDDAVAIFAAGEEVRMTFDAVQPTLAANWTRAFVLDLNGWCKDMDFLTGDGATVAPLPMRDESSAASPDRAALHERFNTRYEAGR